MSYCNECGHELTDRFLENEGMIPYCEYCKAFRFPTFSTAISTIVYNADKSRILLIKQYGRERNVLVAGYVNKGESAEHALVREVKEEMGLDVDSYCFSATEYFEPSNTLMINFACTVRQMDLSGMTKEVDSARWFSKEEAKAQIAHDSLAERFLLKWLKKAEQEENIPFTKVEENDRKQTGG